MPQFPLGQTTFPILVEFCKEVFKGLWPEATFVIKCICPTAMFVHICILDPESEERVGDEAGIRVIGLDDMQKAGEKEGGGDLPVERAASSVGVYGPDDAVAIRIEEGAVLLQYLLRVRSCRVPEISDLRSDAGASLPNRL